MNERTHSDDDMLQLTWHTTTNTYTRRKNLPPQTRQKISIHVYYACIVLLASLPVTRGLICRVCTSNQYVGLHANELGKIRLATGMPYPVCTYYDDVECDRDQDICITIAMNMGRESGWWLQMGCAQRPRFANIKNMGDCATTVQDQVETYYDRNMGGHKKTRTKKVPQTTCVCDTDRCNSSGINVHRSVYIAIVSMLYQYIIRRL